MYSVLKNKVSFLFETVCILACLCRDCISSHGKLKIHNHLRIATYNNPLAGIKNGQSSTNIGLIEKDFLGIFSTDMNFTYDVVVPNDIYQLGVLRQNGSWTGALGLISRNEADISISFGPRNLQRFLMFDLTSPLVTDNIGIMIPYPTIGINPSGFANIFSPVIWWIILVSNFSVIASIWFVGQHFAPQDKIDFAGLALYVVGVILGQGGWIRANSNAFHLIFGVFLLSLVVLIYAYQGTLISRLTAPYYNYLVRSIDDVAADGTIMPFTLKDSATYSEFRDSLLPVFKAVNSRFESYPELLLSNTTDAVETILSKRRSVLIISDIIIENEIKRDYEKTGICRALLLNSKVLVRRNGLFLQKYSQWTHAIDREILLLRQHGLAQQVEDKYKIYTKTRCTVEQTPTGSSRSYNGPLTIYQMKGAFFVLAGGMLFSFTVFILENLLVCATNSKKLKT